MSEREIQIPNIYKKMSEKGFFNKETYFWFYEMRWMDIDKICTYEYEDYESRLVIPFAITGGGDRWLWIKNNESDEYYVGLHEHIEDNGVYYAKNLEDALIRNIIEYVSSASFYVEYDKNRSYQISEGELKKELSHWRACLTGLICDDYIELIKYFETLKLKLVRKDYKGGKYSEWYALLDEIEMKEVIDKYVKFELIEEEFEVYK